MIDLHSHILPGVDDGSKSLEMSLQMARLAVADGITHLACTPHITPGVYDNRPAEIRARVRALQSVLDKAGIDLRLVAGADVHVVPDLAQRLADGSLPCLEGTRYFLFEPPHHVVPPGLLRVAQDAINAGYIPVLTHPERLTWIENAYELVCELDEAGLVVQLTAGSVTGAFGERALHWSMRMLDEGRVDIIASDAHDPRRRPPVLSRARDAVAARLGAEAARRLTLDNPQAILSNTRLSGKERRQHRNGKRKGVSFKKILGLN